MLRLKNISKRYGNDHALSQVYLSIERGKLTVLIGPSGCGKSTLLKLIIGLEKADSGNIEWDEFGNANQSLLEFRQRIGYVIQDGGLFPHLSARKNVTIVAEYLGWSIEKIDNRTDELAELVQLNSGLLKRYPVQLSGGQRQRIGLMRALMLDPDLLLLDEPLGALDPLVRSDLQKDLKNIFQKLNKTVIMVTHDMGEAVYFADHIVLMKKGSVIQQGKVDDLIHRPAGPFVTRFINAQKNPLNQWIGDE